jgi:hypothetical protein
LLRAETGRLTDPGAFTETSDPPPAWLPDAEELPLALPLPELLFTADTGALTALGSVARILMRLSKIPGHYRSCRFENGGP